MTFSVNCFSLFLNFFRYFIILSYYFRYWFSFFILIYKFRGTIFIPLHWIILYFSCGITLWRKAIYKEGEATSSPVATPDGRAGRGWELANVVILRRKNKQIAAKLQGTENAAQSPQNEIFSTPARNFRVLGPKFPSTWKKIFKYLEENFQVLRKIFPST